MLSKLIEPLSHLQNFNEFIKRVGIEQIAIVDMISSQKHHFVHAVNSFTNRLSIFITHSESEARLAYDNFKFMRDDVYYYCSKDIVFYTAQIKSTEIYKSRSAALNHIINNGKGIIVLSIDSLFDRLTPKEYFRNITLNLSSKLSLSNLTYELITLGYERCELVETPGQFAIRGGIVDINMYSSAIRIEFWGDDIDSIRMLDVSTQRSMQNENQIVILPCREIFYTQDEFINAAAKFETEIENLNSEAAFHNPFSNHMKHIDSFVSYFTSQIINVLDYLPSDSLVYLDEPVNAIQNAKDVCDEYHAAIDRHIASGLMLPGQKSLIPHHSNILPVLYKMVNVTMQTFAQTSVVIPNQTYSFKTQMSDAFNSSKINFFITDSVNKTIRRLTNHNVPVEQLRNDSKLMPGIMYVVEGNLSSGFEYENFVVFSESAAPKRKRHSKLKKVAIENFMELKFGDLIVHQNHGIGIYRGIDKIVIDGVARDYIKLDYADGGNLFVNTNQIDMIQKYIGPETAKLNRLGGNEWSKSKSRVKAEVKEMANELITLYAKRKSTTGFAFSPDNIWQNEFELSFPYEETDDQLSAIADVKKDMESETIMDRLICGDVGYGKTEIAIRAAFKAVQDAKQVAYLVPTTVLAHQHYSTFIHRIGNFPVNVEFISRFKNHTEQSKILNGLASGQVDIVIGTHRLLSSDIKFKSLGLVIIDEEQRFGVSHKEKLKCMTENVDVLTLTATPIPRTLHMSLSGLRDMSLLTEPPHERQPIQTYVLEYNDEIIKEAITHELSRNGQVYYLFNRVNQIAKVASKIKKLIPNANVVYTHGQHADAEFVMQDFIDGEIDILVCTTIIETGLDIPNVNTIIIEDADKMGLAQLYQLRGRVGRSNKLAYAYLTYRKDKVLTDISRKRLQTIREFTEFGSGFKIAMRDLEIRGAGNLLGAEQHGNINTVGYDLYCKMLSEAVDELTGKTRDEFDIVIDINIDAFIPQNYIEDEKQKLDAYKKISFINTHEDYLSVQEELIDRYGDLPSSVENLLDIAKIKMICKNIGVNSITQRDCNLIIKFNENASVCVETIMADKNIFFTTNPVPYITLKFDGKLQSLYKFLISIKIN